MQSLQRAEKQAAEKKRENMLSVKKGGVTVTDEEKKQKNMWSGERAGNYVAHN